MSSRSPEELIERHEGFLKCAPTDRALMGYWMGGYFPAEQFPRGTARWREGQAIEPRDVRVEEFAEDYERLYEMHRDAEDDFFMVGSAYWGIPWLEAILGCKVVAGRNTCWAAACGGRAGEQVTVEQEKGSEPSGISNLEENEWFQCMERFTRGLMEIAGGRFPVCPPMLRGAGDAAGAMMGQMEFITGAVDDPEGTRRLVTHCGEVRLEVVRRINEMIPAWHGTYAAGGYPSRVWSKRRVAYSQEDVAALLSPKIFG